MIFFIIFHLSCKIQLVIMPIDKLALSTSLIGGVAVLIAYGIVFSEEKKGYFDSRFWLDIPEATRKAICYIFQIPAALGYLVFILYATGVIGAGVRKGVLQYGNGIGLTLSVGLFSVASVLWPFFTQSHLDKGYSAAYPATALVLAAVAAIVMTAGAFEADLEWPAIVGVIFFSTTVLLADAVGWNAKLIVKIPN